MAAQYLGCCVDIQWISVWVNSRHATEPYEPAQYTNEKPGTKSAGGGSPAHMFVRG
jgi:hypothetical protein